MRVHCFAAYPSGLEPLTRARTSASNPNKAWKPADARCRTGALHKCVMPDPTMSETATVAARPTKSRRTDLSSSFEGCLHRWPPHAALLARELAESWSQKLSHRALQRCHN